MATALAGVHLCYAELFSNGAPSTLAPRVGQRTARLMETLGDILNGIDAVTEDDAWLTPIFAEAQRLWPEAR